MFIAETMEALVHGFLALVRGMERSIYSPQLRKSYFRFAVHCIIISILGYIIVSTTIIGMFPLALMLCFGPVFGPIIFFIACYAFVLILGFLWIIGKFPTALFVGQFGLLRPLFSVPQMARLLTTIIVPMSCDEFMLLGTDFIYQQSLKTGSNENSNGDNEHRKTPDQKNPIRTQYKKSGMWRSLWTFFCNAMFNASVQSFFTFLFRFIPSFRLWIEPIVAAFLLGSQLVAIYTVRIRHKSFLFHMKWCLRNLLRIIGFSLPFSLIEKKSWTGLFVWLGLAYSSASSLVEDLVMSDIQLIL